MPVKQIEKRDGRIVPFDGEKIVHAIWRAEHALNDSSESRAKKITRDVVKELNKRFSDKIPSVEDIQDLVEEGLIAHNRIRSAKAYMIYRQKHSEVRAEQERLIGRSFATKLSLNAVTILKERYLRKDREGHIIETPDDMFRRVAHNIAQADRYYDPKADIQQTEDTFYELMSNLEFLPNSPTLMNAGAEFQQLAACFVLPIEDSIEGIFETLRNTAIIHRSGGGTGFSFSRLRPRNDRVSMTHGASSGPLAYMRVFDMATEAVKQGGKRRGANMAILRVDHPEILEFITLKDKPTELTNFNVSVAVTNEFMKCVEKNDVYPLINPRSKGVVKWLPARDVWNLVVTMAWKNGEPGILFIDRINEKNPTPALGMIESTNPCGEQPLLPYEACNLGSVNLSKFVNKRKIDYSRLKFVIHEAVHFLDNIIDMNKYPVPQIERITRLGNRKIGLGVMGFADMLYLLGIPYSSAEAVKAAASIMQFVDVESKKASENLAKKRGTFPNWKLSIWYPARKLRNATTTTIAPTGTISIIADCSPGIEPNYALVYHRRVFGGTDLVCVNQVFEKILRERNIHSDLLMEKITNAGTISNIKEIPPEMKKIFQVAYDVAPEWHVKNQAAFQKHVDNAVSKTVNFPSDATPQDVEKVFWLAYKLGCKGVTVYRDTTRADQVINISGVSHTPAQKKDDN